MKQEELDFKFMAYNKDLFAKLAEIKETVPSQPVIIQITPEPKQPKVEAK